MSHLERLGAELMLGIGGVIPALGRCRWWRPSWWRAPASRSSELELKARTFRLMSELESAGAHVYIPRREPGTTPSSPACACSRCATLVEEAGTVCTPRSRRRCPCCATTRASIAHLIPPRDESALQMEAAEPRFYGRMILCSASWRARIGEFLTSAIAETYSIQ